MSERAIPRAFVKSWVPSFLAHFEANSPRDDRAFLEPLEKLARNPYSSLGRRDREEVKVRIVIAVTHDRKPNDPGRPSFQIQRKGPSMIKRWSGAIACVRVALWAGRKC